MLRIGILGAGSIGCYLGGRLIAGGHDVVLVGRTSLVDDVAAHGLRVSDADGYAAHLDATRVRVVTGPEALAACDVVLVTVKSRDTAAAGRDLARVLKAGTPVVSFQNGVRNAEILRKEAPALRVHTGMVPFNVLRLPTGAFHRATSGALMVESGGALDAAPIVAALTRSGLPAEARGDMVAVQWGKLLFNVNNALNALAGIPLKEQLQERAYRVLLAATMGETLAALKAAGIKPAASLKAPPAVLPHVLRLPTPLFRLLAAPMLKIDPHARSSMWEDLSKRRPTEIDELNGEIVRLGAAHGVATPVNQRVVALVRKAEAAQAGSPGLSAAALTRALLHDSP